MSLWQLPSLVDSISNPTTLELPTGNAQTKEVEPGEFSTLLPTLGQREHIASAPLYPGEDSNHGEAGGNLPVSPERQLVMRT